MTKQKWIYKSKYIVFYWTRSFDISFELCGYFDNRPRINFDLFIFSLEIILPIANRWINECDPPKWGIAYHNQTLWIYRGGKGNDYGGNKWWTFYSPFSYQWIRTSALRKDGSWEHERRGDRKEFYKDQSGSNILWREQYPYTYKLKSGELQHVTATVEVREYEHRPHWFRWLSLTRKVSRSINVNFDAEIGEESGSYKGGVIGTSHNMLPNETALECLRRMEVERKF